MHEITFYLDFVSPYAWLAFEQLPRTLQGLSAHVRYRPVLLGALLQHAGNPGPAAIAPKRAWTARHVAWLGQSLGCGLDLPPHFPFNSLPLLRLALAHSPDGCINRYTAGSVLRHVWLGGQDPLAPERIAALTQALAEQWQPEGDAAAHAKALLRANTDEAAARGIFGVPMLEVQGRHFWGLDSLPMLRAALDGDAWFDGPAWEEAAQRPSGVPGIQ
ncbi:2-hydroxychromene-2-carboxylate isomerase [Comamonas flocculans]|uniref:2-hydroxychromene-2-carboxylate isomerase n=1 Tax=Comamonas flocculans TaxID=2597701 RepID=A0A5B8RX63_9BURK|nr:2-hydroxychromene-2-carboxylate isomerase [Comamonas flocculans]QEA12397.1 2-hydroxychromene-2-carboxylate isomerase [Comamonas flocculans]